jgi:rhodanese-related sulfurtransferase
MLKLWKNLDLNRKLAFFVLLLGFFAIFAGSPYKGNHVTLNTKEMANIVETTVDHVFVMDLADWIIKNKSDFRVIDLRTSKEFSEYHIPGAENIPITMLDKTLSNKNEKIVIYSEGGIHSAQAWFLLKAEKYMSVYILFGGLEEWKDKVLFPKIPENPSGEQLASFEKIKEISKFFGGSPQSGSAEDKGTPALTMPKLEMPQSTGAPVGGKKKKEGC